MLKSGRVTEVTRPNWSYDETMLPSAFVSVTEEEPSPFWTYAVGRSPAEGSLMDVRLPIVS